MILSIPLIGRIRITRVKRKAHPMNTQHYHRVNEEKKRRATEKLRGEITRCL